MSLELPSGTRCFVDANVLAYSFTDGGMFSRHCRAFIQRVETGELIAHSTLFAYADTIHKTMLAEAMLRFGLEQTGIKRWLERHRYRLVELSTFARAAQTLADSKIIVLATSTDDLVEATRLSREHGLLTNDAIIVALMQRHQLTHLVTNDDDFDAVPGLTIWKPR